MGRGLHVDDALAAAGLEAVHVDVGALAEAVFRDGEDEAGGEAELLVELFHFFNFGFGEGGFDDLFRAVALEFEGDVALGAHHFGDGGLHLGDHGGLAGLGWGVGVDLGGEFEAFLVA